MNKIVFLILMLLTANVKADVLVASLMCVDESDVKNATHTHEPLIVDVKSTDDNMGYAVTKYLSKDNDGSSRRGLTYFKAADSERSQTKNPNFVLFTTRQNSQDLGKDADFLGLDFTDFGTKETPLYRAVVGRGHDNTTKSKGAYFCSLNK